VCHYCDFQLPAPDRCPECRFEGIRLSGLGTERLEEEIRQRYPGLAVLRMDSDTMRKPGSHEEALDKFRAGEARLLIGTQMIAKGLDFPNVMLVGVINADTALHFPDFRAAERTFQLVTQVAGRTGRGAAGGYVLVQTYNPEHPAIQAAIRHDYHQFASQELPGRQAFGYPPFGTLIRLIVRGESEPVTKAYADELGQRIEGRLNSSLRPTQSEQPPVWSPGQPPRQPPGQQPGQRPGQQPDRAFGPLFSAPITVSPAAISPAAILPATLSPANLSPANVSAADVPPRSGGDTPFRLLGPAPCPLAKLRGRFRFHLMLQISDEQSAAARTAIREVQRAMPEPSGVQSLVDVDPVDML
jgi:primosomal protein N'